MTRGHPQRSNKATEGLPKVRGGSELGFESAGNGQGVLEDQRGEGGYKGDGRSAEVMELTWRPK